MSGETTKRSPFERIVVWGLIACLIGVIVIEYTARNNYENALAKYRKIENPTLQKLQDSFNGESIGRIREDEFGVKEVPLEFFSLFKDYRLIARLEKSDAEVELAEQAVTDIYTPLALEAEKNRPIEIASANAGAFRTPSNPFGATAGGPRPGGAAQSSTESQDDAPESDSKDSRLSGKVMASVALDPNVQRFLGITGKQDLKLQQLFEKESKEADQLTELDGQQFVDQLATCRSEIESEIEAIVSAEQFKTLLKMTWTREGSLVLLRSSFCERLKLTEQQTTELTNLYADFDAVSPPAKELMAILTKDQIDELSKLTDGVAPTVPESPK